MTDLKINIFLISLPPNVRSQESYCLQLSTFAEDKGGKRLTQSL